MSNQIICFLNSTEKLLKLLEKKGNMPTFAKFPILQKGLGNIPGNIPGLSNTMSNARKLTEDDFKKTI